jgi:hypothetical protein
VIYFESTVLHILNKRSVASLADIWCERSCQYAGRPQTPESPAPALLSSTTACGPRPTSSPVRPLLCPREIGSHSHWLQRFWLRSRSATVPYGSGCRGNTATQGAAAGVRGESNYVQDNGYYVPRLGQDEDDSSSDRTADAGG